MTTFAFLFPGQGSQSVGMLSEAADAFPVIEETFAEASAVLGYDLWELACSGPAETQALTAKTQPLILTASVALFRLWRQCGGAMPEMMAGHSLGEFSALVAAGSLDFADAVALVQLRGEAMQAAVPVGEGAMAAIIGLDDGRINDICKTLSRGADYTVCAVNFNAPGQVVIAGHTAAVNEATHALKEAGAKRALPLPVSAPFHTPLMMPAGLAVAERLSSLTLLDPKVPVVSNVSAQPQSDAEAVRELLIQQVSAPVLWTGCVATMVNAGVREFAECGPGKVLSGLLRRIDKSLSCLALEAPADMRAGVSEWADINANQDC